MKKSIFRGLAMALALLLCCGMALAEVRTTGNVWMRTGPGLNYDTVVSISEGKTLEYLGETRMDERPVAWYKVSDGKHTGWVSSRYSKLVGEDASAQQTKPEATAAPKPAATATPTPTPEPVVTPEPTATPASLPAVNAGLLFSTLVSDDPADDVQPTPTPTPTPGLPAPTVELSRYYQSELVVAANEIGLISYRQVASEVPFQYYNDALILAGNQYVENIVVYGEGYEVYGAHVGMNINAAMACMNAAGLDYVASMNGVTYEHRGDDTSPFVDANGHDSCINLWVNDDDIVTEIDWSTYTG